MNKASLTVIKWEKGRSNIKAIDLDKLCELYGVPKDIVILPTKLA